MNDLRALAANAVDLSGKQEPSEQVDLRGPIDEQTFRKLVVSIGSSIADSLEKLAFHGERAMPLQATRIAEIEQHLKRFVEKFDAVEMIDGGPLAEPTAEQQEADRPIKLDNIATGD